MRQRHRSGTTAGLSESTATGFCKRFPLYIAPDYAVKQAASKVAGHCQLAWINNCMPLPASATAWSCFPEPPAHANRAHNGAALF